MGVFVYTLYYQAVQFPIVPTDGQPGGHTDSHQKPSGYTQTGAYLGGG